MHTRSLSRLPDSLRRICGLPAVLLAANAGILLPVQAGPGVDASHDKVVIETERTRTVRPPKISKLPYLVLVEPAPLKLKAPAGPYLRQPPLLPKPTPSPLASKAPKTPSPEEPAANANKPNDSGVLPSEAPPILLSKEKPSSTPAPAPVDRSRQESVLTPAPNPEQELKDAVIYFDTPVGPRGSRAIVPVPVPGLTPVTPQTVVPESHAKYREVEK